MLKNLLGLLFRWPVLALLTATYHVTPSLLERHEQKVADLRNEVIASVVKKQAKDWMMEAKDSLWKGLRK